MENEKDLIINERTERLENLELIILKMQSGITFRIMRIGCFCGNCQIEERIFASNGMHETLWFVRFVPGLSKDEIIKTIEQS